mgnify:FL=1
MMAALILVPLLAGLLSLAVRAAAIRRTLLVLVAVAHTAMAAAAISQPPDSELGGWLVLDALGSVFLGLLSLLFLAAAVYGTGYLAREAHHPSGDVARRGPVDNQPQAVFTCCLLLFLATMTLVTVSHSFGLL